MYYRILIIMMYMRVPKGRECDPDDMSRVAAKAHKFLKDFADLAWESIDLKQALQQMNKLKDNLEKDAVNCQWLQQFF